MEQIWLVTITETRTRQYVVSASSRIEAKQKGKACQDELKDPMGENITSRVAANTTNYTDHYRKYL